MRKVFYNITITSISVLVALVIGTIELVGVLADQAHITSGPLAAIAEHQPRLRRLRHRRTVRRLPGWSRSAVWRFGRIEERWSADLQV